MVDLQNDMNTLHLGNKRTLKSCVVWHTLGRLTNILMTRFVPSQFVFRQFMKTRRLILLPENDIRKNVNDL